MQQQQQHNKNTGTRDDDSSSKNHAGNQSHQLGSFNYFSARDVVRHPLVASIIEAYDEDSKRKLNSVKLEK